MPWSVPRTSCHPTISVDRAPECPALGNPFHSVRGSDLAAIPGMATVHRLPTRIDPGPGESILGRLLTLAKLELELGLAETRDVLVSAAIAVAAGILASVLLTDRTRYGAGCGSGSAAATISILPERSHWGAR